MKKRERQQSDDWDFDGEGEEGELVCRSRRLDGVSACFRLAFGALMVVYAVHMAPINPKRQISGSGAAVRHATGRLKFKGCYRLESQLPKRKIYGGGVFGANIDEAIRMAKHEKRRYIALAKTGSEGHAFTFDEAPTGPKLARSDAGCDNKCNDAATYACGCADSGCVGLERQADEEHLRRWVVYDLAPGTVQAPVPVPVPAPAQGDAKSHPSGPPAPAPRDERPTRLKFMGCYRLQSQLPKRLIYGGGVFGANINQAIRMAKHEKRRYVALAKNGSEGHAFTFDEAPAGPKLDYTDPGCNRKCEDNTLFVCGCADSGCVGLERQVDEEHLRRWVVYDLYAETETEKKRKLAEEKSAEEEKKKFLKWASGSPAGAQAQAQASDEL